MARSLLALVSMANTTQGNSINIGDMINDLEATFRQSMTKLGEWSEQAREVLHERPGTITSSLAIAGFLAGALLRNPEKIQPAAPLKFAPRHNAALDPVIIFLGTAVLGFAFGSKLFEGGTAFSQGKPQKGAGPTPRASDHTH